jgi:DNA-binding GntR family transcriptional regulator
VSRRYTKRPATDKQPATDEQPATEPAGTRTRESRDRAGQAPPGAAELRTMPPVGPDAGTRRWANESDRVYELLRDDLISGMFAPREQLVEEKLAKRYDASRTPVRAAMLRLVSDRLLEARPRSATVVREITGRDIRQIYEMRQALECFAVETAAARINRDQLHRLMTLYRAPQPGSAEGAPESVLHKGVIPLHQLIVESLGNGRLTDVLCTQCLPIARTQALYWRMANPRVDGLERARRTEAVREHREIVEALLVGDQETARTALSAHLQRAADHLLELMATVDLVEPRLAAAEDRTFRRPPNVFDHMIHGVDAQDKDFLA